MPAWGPARGRGRRVVVVVGARSWRWSGAPSWRVGAVVVVVAGGVAWGGRHGGWCVVRVRRRGGGRPVRAASGPSWSVGATGVRGGRVVVVVVGRARSWWWVGVRSSWSVGARSWW